MTPTPDQSPLRIVEAESAEHIGTLVRLARDIWAEHYTPIIGQAQVDYMLDRFQSPSAIAAQRDEGYEYYLLEKAGRPLGYVAVLPAPDRAALFLSKIYISSVCRGHGLGRQLLAFVETLARQRQLKTIWLTVNRHNTHSIAWYARQGFRTTGPVVQDIGGGFVMDDFRMEKALRPGASSSPA